ncbi:Fcf1-domain-containing protein [Stachybotrys elegans]|uniref:U three protein 23 n=1 Tax=Stachybotrys elegans TaxID=80388 RepID=A0A8K0T1U5_9HYPO|nr:Fcf1-domain-containing protein [Stachybotrys elegans]
MRLKRGKQYRKLMEQFSMTFGFREPYQILVDAEMVKDACRFKMELEPSLQRTVRGKVKPMITQCEIRKLYAQKKEPGVNEAIELAKTYERRRCGHHPEEYPEPLSTMECLQSVVDPKSTGQNKHRYVVASQSRELRRAMRRVQGVPLIYIDRSVMILEPMADESVRLRAREERLKFRAEIKNPLGKRKREEKEDEEGEEKDGQPDDSDADSTTQRKPDTQEKKKKRKGHGPKGPNPLSVKKTKKKTAQNTPSQNPSTASGNGEATTGEPGKRKRRRRNKDGAASEGDGATPITAVSSAPAGEES